MKVVEREADAAEALASAQREAQSSFGDSRMLVEKYVLKPRHVEIRLRRPARQLPVPERARLLDPAPPSEGGRRGPCPGLSPSCAVPWAKPR